jgi:hypothetical protein
MRWADPARRLASVGAWREINSTAGKWARAKAATGVAVIRQHTVQSALLLITPESGESVFGRRDGRAVAWDATQVRQPR